MRKWSVFQHDDGLRLHEVDFPMIEYRRNPPEFVCNVIEQIDIPKIGEGVKTKRVEVKARRGDCLVVTKTGLVTIPVAFQSDLDDFTRLGSLNEVTLSFEIPLPERKVEISENMLSDEWSAYMKSGLVNSMTYFEWLKDKYFGSEGE